MSGEIGPEPVLKLIPVTEKWKDRENVDHLLPLMVENIVRGGKLRSKDVHVLVRTYESNTNAHSYRFDFFFFFKVAHCHVGDQF